jgi:hypothetical protein
MSSLSSAMTFDYLISMLDWDANVNPEFAKSHFITAAAAEGGVLIENLSTSDPLIMLKHFGPGNPDAQPLVRD